MKYYFWLLASLFIGCADRSNLLVCSHPGYYGKKGMRHYNVHKNRFFMKVINLDKLWTLVSEDTRKASTNSKAAVIDVTKAVSQNTNK